MKKLFIRTSIEGGRVFLCKNLNVTSTLTYCTVDVDTSLSLLLELLKRDVVHSFEPVETYIRVIFRTKYVDEIL